jgi:hypothetical protein
MKLNPYQIKCQKIETRKKINHTKRILKNKGENIKNINHRGQTKIFNWRFKLN